MTIHNDKRSQVIDRQPYPVLRSKVERASSVYQANRQLCLTQLEKLAKALAKANEGGGEKYNARHRAAQKLLPRERVELLLDRDGYFLEVGGLAGHNMSGQASGAGLIGGVGVVSGVECAITATEATVKGGSVSEIGVQKSARI